MDEAKGHHVAIGDTRLYVVERGAGFPVFILHGGPGLDHHMFGDYLEPLTRDFRLIYVDERGQGRSDRAGADTWTLVHMARDIGQLASAMKLGRYAVLGHSFGALVALQNAVDFPGEAAATIISSGVPSAKYLDHVDQSLEAFEPTSLRDRIAASWAREKVAVTVDDVAALLHDQMPFHFANPVDARMGDYEARTSGSVYSPDILRHFAAEEYGGIEVEDRLGVITQPVLILVGRFDRVSSLPAAEAMRRGIPSAEMTIFEHSGHMTFVEENDLYLQTVAGFLRRHTGAA